MRATDIASAIREALARKGTTAYRASLDAGLPGNAIRYALEERATKSDRLAEICEALGLEFYVGPPRGPGAKAEASAIQGRLREVARELEKLRTRALEAVGPPPKRGLSTEAATAIRMAIEGTDGTGTIQPLGNEDLPPGARPVDVVELAAAAGGGAEALGEEIAGCVWFRQDWLDRRSLDPTQCAVIRVSGESMEPLLREGDSILVDRKRRRRLHDRIFVVRTDDGLVVKRAGRGDDGRWLLISEHPSWAPAPWPADAETIGQAVWTARSLV